MTTKLLLPALASIGMLCSAASAQYVQTIPRGYDTRDGNTRLGSPFYTTNTARWNFVYDSSNFDLQIPIRIKEISFRADRLFPQWPATTYPQFECNLAESLTNWDSYNQQFSLNFFATPFSFFNGSLQVQAGSGTGVPLPWSVILQNQTGFVYDPSLGRDFIIELRTPAAPSGLLYRMDAHSGSQIMATRYGHPVNANATTWTNSSPEMAPIVRIAYEPANGVYVDFDANPRSGFSPQAVSFTDMSVTSTPNGIISWAWDFDNDGTIDSTAQNPSHTYTAPGKYTVALTVVDSVHGSFTGTKQDFIEMDPPPVANFGADGTRGPAPLLVRFKDSSTNRPTAWAWDFESDGTVDSTVQDPSFTYVSSGIYDVTLTATSIGGSGTRTRTAYIVVSEPTWNTNSAQILHYGFNETRGDKVANIASCDLAPPFGTMSSTTWQGDPGRRLFKGLEPGTGCIKTNPTHQGGDFLDTGWMFVHNGSFTMMWWERMGPVGPSQARAYIFGAGGLRCFCGSVAGSGFMVEGLPVSRVAMNNSVQANPGVWEHIALVVDARRGAVEFYQNGTLDPNTASFTPGAILLSASNLIIGASDSAGTDSLTAWFDLDDFRLYSTALSAAQIQAAMGEEVAAGALYGQGCAGPGGQVPQIGLSDAPILGHPLFALTLSSAEPARPAALLIGLSSKWMVPNLLALPLPLRFLGSGCQLETTMESILALNTGAGSISIPTPLPNDPSIQGSHGNIQIVILGTSGAMTQGMDVGIH